MAERYENSEKDNKFRLISIVEHFAERLNIMEKRRPQHKLDVSYWIKKIYRQPVNIESFQYQSSIAC